MKLLRIFVSFSCCLGIQAMDSQPVSPIGSPASAAAAASCPNSPATQELKNLTTQKPQELTPRTALVARRIQGLGFKDVENDSPSNERYQSNTAVGINPNKIEARKRANEDPYDSDGYNADTEGSPRKKARISINPRKLDLPPAQKIAEKAAMMMDCSNSSEDDDIL